MGTLKQITIGVIIGLIVNGLVLGLPFVLNYFGVDYPFNLLMSQFPLWITLLVVIILVPSIIMLSRPKRSGGIFVGGGRNRPESNVYEIEYNYARVKWKVLYGKASPYRSAESHAFCESNPRCPECKYEMEAEKRGIILKRYHWKCERCGKFYRCPTSHPFDAHEVVERLVEADVRSGRLEFHD